MLSRRYSTGTLLSAVALCLTAGVIASAWAQDTAKPAATQKEVSKPKKPPRGAIVLFNGKDAVAWLHLDGRPVEWTIADDTLTVEPGKGNIVTKEKYGDYQLHVEFNIPYLPDKHGQERGNSGVYQHGLYEVQILDAVNNPTYAFGGCAAIYELKDPDKNVAKPPETWQTYDITFRAPRFDDSGKVVANPRITVLWNGVKVHDNVEITHGPTRASLGGPMVKTGPMMLQDHGSRVKYRNIWIKPLSRKKARRRCR